MQAQLMRYGSVQQSSRGQVAAWPRLVRCSHTVVSQASIPQAAAHFLLVCTHRRVLLPCELVAAPQQLQRFKHCGQEGVDAVWLQGC
jgi:hypothetical protein